MSSTTSESISRTDSSAPISITSEDVGSGTQQSAKMASETGGTSDHVESVALSDHDVDVEPHASHKTGDAANSEGPSKLGLAAFLETILGNEQEDKEEVAYQLSEVLRYPSIAEPLSSRRKMSKRRNIQALSYFALLEDTIKSLEARLEAVEHLKAHKDDEFDKDVVDEETSSVAAVDKEKEEEDQKPEIVLEASFLPWDRYILPSPEEKKLAPYLIEVCVEPPRPEADTKRTTPKEESAAAQDGKSTIVKPPPVVAHLDPSKFDYTKIERIRLRSGPVCALLEKWFGLSIENGIYGSQIRPFKALYVAEEKLRKRHQELTSAIVPSEGESKDDKDLREHLACVLNFMDTSLKGLLERFSHFRKSDDTLESFKVRFNELWYLFQPGRIIYDTKEHQAYLVVTTVGGRPLLRTSRADPDEIKSSNASAQSADGTVNTFCISAIYLGFNGKEIGPVQRDITISAYEGLRQITDLQVFPIEYGSNTPGHLGPSKGAGSSSATSLKAILEERGKKFIEMTARSKPCHREYNGFTIGDVPEQVESQIIVDFDFFYKTKPGDLPEFGVKETYVPDPREIQDSFRPACSCGSPGCDLGHYDVWNDAHIDEAMTKNFKEDNHLLFRWTVNQDQLKQKYAFLLPRIIHGFVLHSRTWSALDIDNISQIKMNPRGFEDLVLPAEHKRIVEAVVRTHSVGARPVEGITTEEEVRVSEDLVRGKGKGIIMLLHGVPGVGKTSTAETIATLTGRPLFSLTCGDIGDAAQDVQDNLEKNFTLAHRWGCVMLLDEADVFLQQRSRHDMKRNAIVSVFLRVLEYYSGILFLTTNKVGTFDEAFKSRIHIALYYKQLDRSQTLQIWKNNLLRLKANRAPMEVNVKELMKWAKDEWKSSKQEAKEKSMPHRPWNGRQIHNACQTAAALAEYEACDASKKITGPVKLTPANLRAVADATKEFDKYLLATHGKDETGRAEEQKDRGDDAFMTPKRSARKNKKKSQDSDEDSDDDGSEDSDGDSTDDAK